MQINITIHQAKASCRAGFTLAEALIATMVVGVSFVGLVGGLIQGDDIIQNSQQNLRASQIMTQQMETLRLYTWDQLTNNGYIPLTNTFSYYPSSMTNSSQGVGVTYYESLVVTNSPLSESYSTDIKQVTVTVTWSSASGQHQRQMSTLASHYGMQNYIYK